jgi:hypothetical protein
MDYNQDWDGLTPYAMKEIHESLVEQQEKLEGQKLPNELLDILSVPRNEYSLPSLDDNDNFELAYEPFEQLNDKSAEICLSMNEDDDILNLRPKTPPKEVLEKESDQGSATKIVIKIDNYAGEDVSHDSVKSEKADPEPVEIDPSVESEPEEVKQTPARRPKPKKKAMKKVINSHNQKRNDVVLKSILRSMRRYLCKEFLQITKFKKTEKQHKVRKENLIRCANKLIDELEFPIQANNFQFYFLALAYPSELKKVLSDEDQNAVVNQAVSVVTLIENVLNRFSKKIFKHFMEVPEISVLVQHFLNNNTEDLDNIEGFEPCINMLDEKSKEVISTIVDDPTAFDSNPYLIKQPLFIFQTLRD